MVQLHEFEDMVRKHDLTYNYSDDGAVWRRGQDSYDAIRKAATRLPQSEVARIWNKIVDEKILDSHRQQFYWKEAK